MIAFHGMLIGPANEAGIPVPDVIPSDLESENFDHQKYIKWIVYSRMQLGASMPRPDSHWENARIIAGLPDEILTMVTPKQLLEEYGFEIGDSSLYA